MGKPNRAGDPGASEFSGDPDDIRVGRIPGAGSLGPDRMLLDIYWQDPDDPGAAPDKDGIHIGDDDSRVTTEGLPRKNQFRSAPKPTWPKTYRPN